MEGTNTAESAITPAWAELNAAIEGCERCRPELNIKTKTESAPGYGSKSSPVVIVGQSLCKRCMEHKEPFRGGSERFITAALKVHGRSKKDLFVTNIVHCHPPNDRSSRTTEIENCREYLHRELDLVAPRLVIGLGRDERAHHVLQGGVSQHRSAGVEARRPAAGAGGGGDRADVLSPPVVGEVQTGAVAE